ncbi:hypothetical protein [Variovorax paradoxus]|uniref:hypothetical protein n=1 Tax=Variovorax paradoxus TaxID=34073 RepID=UPI003ECE3417
MRGRETALEYLAAPLAMNKGSAIPPDAVARGGRVADTAPATMNAGNGMRPSA